MQTGKFRVNTTPISCRRPAPKVVHESLGGEDIYPGREIMDARIAAEKAYESHQASVLRQQELQKQQEIADSITLREEFGRVKVTPRAFQK